MAKFTRLAQGARPGSPRRLTTRTRVGRVGPDADLSHDALTGLSDHWAFREALHREVALSRRFGEPFVLMLIDVDDFTFVNDSLGRTAGTGSWSGSPQRCDPDARWTSPFVWGVTTSR